METRDLILLLSRRAHAADRRYVRWRWAAGLALGLLASLALLWPQMPAEGSAVATVRTAYWLDLAVATALGMAALVLAVRLGRPAGSVRARGLVLALPLCGLALMGALEWWRMPGGLPETAWHTFMADVLRLYVPIFAAAFWCMRGQAPTRLALAGAAAGALAGALATLLCTVFALDLAMSPWRLWHVLGVAVPALVGTLLGPVLLRW